MVPPSGLFWPMQSVMWQSAHLWSSSKTSRTDYYWNIVGCFKRQYKQCSWVAVKLLLCELGQVQVVFPYCRIGCIAFPSLKGLRLKLIDALYGEHYFIYTFYVDTDEVGHHGARRERIYLILAHKQRTIQCYDPHSLYDLITNHIKSVISTRPRDYFFSSIREVQLAAADLARTRGRRMKPASWFKCWNYILHCSSTYFHPNAWMHVKDRQLNSCCDLLTTGSFPTLISRCISHRGGVCFQKSYILSTNLGYMKAPGIFQFATRQGTERQATLFEVLADEKGKRSPAKAEKGLQKEVRRGPGKRPRSCYLFGGFRRAAIMVCC